MHPKVQSFQINSDSEVLQVVKNLLLLLISSALSFGALEIALRFLMPERLAFVPALFNNDLTYEPNQIQRSRHLEWDYEIRINADGFRNDRNIHEISDNSVLVLGDSFAEGYGVPLDRAYSKVLERSLQKIDANIHVYNGGHSGTNLGHYRRVYEEIFRKNDKIDGVIISLFVGNDLIGTDRSPNSSLRIGTEFDNGWVYRLKIFLGSRVATYAVLNYVVKTNANLDSLCKKLGACDDPQPPMIYNEAAVENAVPRTSKFIQSFVELIRNDGNKVVVLLIPTREQVQDKLWQSVLEQYGKDLDPYRLTVNHRLTAALTAADIPVVDFTELAINYDENSAENLYFEYDGHWTEQGHRLAAAGLADYIDSGWK